MSWTLGSTTLPNPKTFNRRFLEKSVYHDMINGTSKKDITSKKEQFLIGFTRLTQSTVASILAEYTVKSSLAFSVTDGDLTISERQVHLDIAGRDYNTKGSEFREDITLVLTDVDKQY